MGYSSKFRGELSITSGESYPEELIAAAKNTGFELPSLAGLSKEALDKLKANNRYSYLFDISATKIKPSGNDGYVEDGAVESLVKAISESGAIVNGELVRLGEEQGDLERFVVKDNIVTVDTAELVWTSDKTLVPYELYEL